MLGSIIGLVVTYPAGALVDRFGRKTVIVPATVLTGLPMLAVGVAPSYPGFLLATGVWGAATATSRAVPATYATDSTPRR